MEESPPGVTITGLALAERYFGPLLSPIAATPEQWTAYTEHRRRTNAQHKNVFNRRKRLISDAVAGIEGELDLDDGTLRKCVSVMWRDVEWDDDDVRDAEIGTRIYSLATPKYIDVHIKYHRRPGAYDVEWDYSLGYKIHHQISNPPTRYRNPSTKDAPSSWHTRGGWQSVCWGYYADNDDDIWLNCDYENGPDWRRLEEGEVGLRPGGALDIYEALFGPISTPPSDNADAVLTYRRKLVAGVCLLFAAVGIDYRVACTDEETDGCPEEFMLEGLSDTWVARGIRAACGFQLSDDAEAARLGAEEREEEAAGEDYGDEDEDEEEGSFSDEESL
ncbi:hypothetical protein JVT61DRAFT_4730 [Boletus reticuloceps]|uniref:Uncharacterized protein n=1 Tax=Boletus reticuloceps TaxID=495285 RepID=A0A8I2YM20_9AGAM|nr:hypothetical protein JVT61DRAFT_4730 [Boletus reticuloceps]